MNTDLTEEEMRRALFGGLAPAPQVTAPLAPKLTPQIGPGQLAKLLPIKKTDKAFTPRLRVTLQVGNEFEGKTSS